MRVSDVTVDRADPAALARLSASRPEAAAVRAEGLGMSWRVMAEGNPFCPAPGG